MRRLQCDPDLAAVSHVFVDEVHERDLNTDFVLIILRDLLLRRKSLKLVLMSATLNADTFSDYFGGVPTVEIPGRAYPVTEYRLEDVLEFTGYTLPAGHDCALKQPVMDTKTIKQRFPKCSPSTQKTLQTVDESIINYELVSVLISYIHENFDDGAILVFMPGLMEITKTIEALTNIPIFNDCTQTRVFPLHSTLSTAEQTAIFEIPPPGVRKVVIGTNIAETSITIEDVVYVVDAGRVKENREDEVAQMMTLVECWVSRASAKQRRGRAGRVRPGVAFHLFSSVTNDDTLSAYTLPEMLRVRLDDLVMQILLLDLGEPRVFLNKAVDPPSEVAVNNSLKMLQGLAAVEIEKGGEKVRVYKSRSDK